jgi:malonyl-CoA/methylmalonyl-CoA synthetase
LHLVSFPPIQPGNSQIALVEGAREVSYGELAELLARCAAGLLGGEADLNEERVAFFIPGSVDYVTVMHGVWRAGGIAVPLNVASTIPELEHYLSCARATRLVAGPAHHPFLRELCERLGVSLLTVDDVMAPSPVALPAIDPARRAMMIFTSGTTNKPKGVISTHANVASQSPPCSRRGNGAQDDTIRCSCRCTTSTASSTC